MGRDRVRLIVSAPPRALVVTLRGRRTLIVSVDGSRVASSPVFDHKRRFNNEQTGEWIDAPLFTPRNVKADPSIVVDFLAQTGTPMSIGVVVVF